MTDLSTATAQAQVAKNTQLTIRDLVQAQQSAIEMQLAGALNSGAFVRAAISSISSSPALQQATPQSVLGAIMLAAQLKLEIGPALGHFYLTPRMDRGTQICLPIVGYQGLIELAYRSGRITKIETFLIREGDHFDYWADSKGGLQYTWRPKDFEATRDWTGVVVSASLTSGGDPIWAYLTREQVYKRRPNGWERGPWKTHDEEMARKTAVREVSPYLPKSTEFAEAIKVTRQVEEENLHASKIAGVPDLVMSGEAEVVKE
jgi:recombination protein RecT